MAQIWGDTGEQESCWTLGIGFVYVESAVSVAQRGSPSKLNIECPWHPLGGCRTGKLELRKQM